MTDPDIIRNNNLATAQDVARVLAVKDAASVVAIMALSPTVADIEEAALWAAGEGETLTRRHQPHQTVKAILNILRPEAEWDDPSRA